MRLGFFSRGDDSSGAREDSISSMASITSLDSFARDSFGNLRDSTSAVSRDSIASPGDAIVVPRKVLSDIDDTLYCR